MMVLKVVKAGNGAVSCDGLVGKLQLSEKKYAQNTV